MRKKIKKVHPKENAIFGIERQFIHLEVMISAAKAFNLKHQRLWMLPQKGIYWQKKKTLLVADLHIGKSGHFRKNGIPVPGKVNNSNLELLNELIRETKPGHLILLGDLFHSKVNKEWQAFNTWRKKHTNLEVSLLTGNHDILPKSVYHASHVNIFKRLSAGPFLFVHDVNKLPDAARQEKYVLSGHIHPAIELKGRGRQRMKLPCFYFGENQGILPAFGQFTGTHIIRPQTGDRVFTIVDSQVLSINT